MDKQRTAYVCGANKLLYIIIMREPRSTLNLIFIYVEIVEFSPKNRCVWNYRYSDRITKYRELEKRCRKKGHGPFFVSTPNGYFADETVVEIAFLLTFSYYHRFSEPTNPRLELTWIKIPVFDSRNFLRGLRNVAKTKQFRTLGLTLFDSRASAECSSFWRKQFEHLLLLKMFGANFLQSDRADMVSLGGNKTSANHDQQSTRVIARTWTIQH